MASLWLGVTASDAADAASLTASTMATNAAVGNVQKARPSAYWRSTAATGYIVYDRGSAFAMDTVLLGWCNAQSGDTFRLRIASSVANLTAAPAYDSTALSVWPAGVDWAEYERVHRVFTFAAQTQPCYRLDFDFSGNTDGYVELGRIKIGARVEPAEPVDYGLADSGEEPVVVTTDYGGEDGVRARGVRRKTEAIYSDLRETEWLALRRLWQRAGQSSDVAFVADDAAGASILERTFSGLVSNPVASRVTSYDRYAASVTVRELAPLRLREA